MAIFFLLLLFFDNSFSSQNFSVYSVWPILEDEASERKLMYYKEEKA